MASLASFFWRSFCRLRSFLSITTGKRKHPRIGQIKKRYLLRIMRRWILVAITGCVIGLSGAAIYYLVPNVSFIEIPAKGKAYVHVSDAKLEPLTKDKPMVLHVLVENTGTVEATGYFKDITCKFSDIEPRSLPYMSSAVIINFKLAPSEKVVIRLPFETILDDWRLKMLNENRAELYFYARGDYWDEIGNKGELSFCRQYTRSSLVISLFATKTLPSKNQNQ